MGVVAWRALDWTQVVVVEYEVNGSGVRVLRRGQKRWRVRTGGTLFGTTEVEVEF